LIELKLGAGRRRRLFMLLGRMVNHCRRTVSIRSWLGMRPGMFRFAIGGCPGSFGPGLMMRFGMVGPAGRRRTGWLLVGPAALPAGMADGGALRGMMPGGRFMIGLLGLGGLFFLPFEQGQ